MEWIHIFIITLFAWNFLLTMFYLILFGYVIRKFVEIEFSILNSVTETCGLFDKLLNMLEKNGVITKKKKPKGEDGG